MTDIDPAVDCPELAGVGGFLFGPNDFHVLDCDRFNVSHAGQQGECDCEAAKILAGVVAEVRRLRAERDALAAARNDEPGRKRHEYAEAEITHYGETFTACIVCREDKSDWRHSTAARVLAEVHAAEEGGGR